MDLKRKNKIIGWFKYHHYKTNCAEESHRDFMSALSTLETMSNTICDEINNDDMWKAIHNAVNILTAEQIDNFYNKFFVNKLKN